MAYHTIMLPSAVMSKDVDSLVRSAKSATTDLDNGSLVQLNTGVSSTYGEGQVYLATQPATGSLNNLWMIGDPEVVVTDGKYKGIDVNVRDFYTPTGSIFSVFKPKLYDIIELTGEAFTNSIGEYTYASAANGSYLLTWASSPTSNATSFKLVKTTYISVPIGFPGSGNRVTSYKLECITE